MPIHVVAPSSASDWRRARELVEEYAASLDVDLAFQDFAQEVEHLETEYGPPSGAFLLADLDAVSVGCVGLRRCSSDAGEIKRLFVSPAGRGRRIGRLLAEGIIVEGRRLGYARLVLDTLPSMTVARVLYESLGFTPIAPYRFNPVAGTAYLELRLR